MEHWAKMSRFKNKHQPYTHSKFTRSCARLTSKINYSVSFFVIWSSFYLKEWDKP